MTQATYKEPIDTNYTVIDDEFDENGYNYSNESTAKSKRSNGLSNIQSQIDCLDQELYPFGFTFLDIAKDSPKKQKDKYDCADIISTLIKDQKMMGAMLEKGYLPIRLLSKRAKVAPKIVEAHEGYIVMAALVITGNYPDLQPYFDYVFGDE